MKKLVKLVYLVLFLVIFSFSAYAAITANEVYLTVNQIYELGGKKITILNVNPDGGLIVDIDHVQGIIPKRGALNGVYIATVQVYDANEIQYRAAIINISVYFQCGDGTCEGSESSTCCKDCGCFGNRVCVDNYCQFNQTIQKACFRDNECPVNNTCTTAKCLNYQCIYTVNETCNLLAKNSTGACLVDSECVDTDPCTINKCENRFCTSSKQEGCALNDNCLSKGFVDNKKYCDGVNFIGQKGFLSSCQEKYECSSNTCTAKRCMPNIKGQAFLTFFGLIVVFLGLYFYLKFNYRRTIKI